MIEDDGWVRCPYCKHKLKTVKLGVKIKNADFINSKIKGLLEKYAVEKKDSISLKEKEEKK